MSNLTEQEKNMRALISASKTVATAEGVTDEDLLIARTNEIYNDARQPVPATEAGNKAREGAIEILKANELAEAQGRNPYGSTGYDYEQFFDERVPPAIVKILLSLTDFAHGLSIPSQSKPMTDEQVKEFEDTKEKASLAWFKILNESGVPMTKYENLFKELRDIITSVENVIADQVAGHGREILSRSYKAINPGTNLLDLNFALYSDLLGAREYIKTYQDEADGEDRYSFRKKDSMKEGE